MLKAKSMNKENLRVEFKTDRINSSIFRSRFCYWRIVPSELGLFRRLFFNHWQQVWFVDGGRKETWFTPSDFTTLKSKYKTVGDMVSREKRLKEILEKQWNEEAKKWDNA